MRTQGVFTMFLRVTAAIVLFAGSALAQTPPQAPAGPSVGEVAPDFSGPGASREGTLKEPVHLATLRGKTVVLAFFPAARTRGCTAQMEGYRDQYADLFNGGKDVVLLGISTDADTTLANWAKDAGFPFQFVSDKEGNIGKLYGTLSETQKSERRYVYVIGPDGKITHTIKPFQPFAPPHFLELGEAVRKTLSHAHQ
jgi:peroxiredoxin Q/BCP